MTHNPRKLWVIEARVKGCRDWFAVFSIGYGTRAEAREGLPILRASGYATRVRQYVPEEPKP